MVISLNKGRRKSSLFPFGHTKLSQKLDQIYLFPWLIFKYEMSQDKAVIFLNYVQMP